MTKEEYMMKIKRQYSYMDDCDIEDLYYEAKEMLLNVLDPMHSVCKGEVPQEYEYTLYRLMKEMCDLSGASNFISYTENGVSWRRETSQYTTLSEITPYGA